MDCQGLEYIKISCIPLKGKEIVRKLDNGSVVSLAPKPKLAIRYNFCSFFKL